jgi:hypothetical protein
VRGRAPRIRGWRLWGAALSLVAACTGGPSAPEPGAVDPRAALRATCALPSRVIRLTWAGYDPARSGQIQLVPEPFNYFGPHSHSGPWPYLQHVPLLFYGPGHVPARGPVRGPVTSADIGPTLARHVGFDLEAPDGSVLPRAVLPGASPPRLVVTVVWDGGGRNVLEEHPDAWPTLRSLIQQGVWFEDATVGTSPSVTPAVHATLATGALPRRHGLIGLGFPTSDGWAPASEVVPYLREPTLADRYDVARRNRPVIGLVGNKHTVGMLGHGAGFEGGDRDIALLYEPDGTWAPAQEPYFELPAYVDRVPGLGEAIRRVDLEDGRLDDRWKGREIRDGVTDTPAFSIYQGAVVSELIRREGFGADAVPDLLFLNFKQIDRVSHMWSMHGSPMEAVVRSSDAALRDLIAVLDREVGPGEWVLALTADHGSSPDASVSGGFPLDVNELRDDVDRALGDGDDRPLVPSGGVAQLYVDEAELAEGAHSLQDVIDLLLDYRARDAVSDPSELPPGEPNRRVFASAFPSTVLDGGPPDCRAEG